MYSGLRACSIKRMMSTNQSGIYHWFRQCGRTTLRSASRSVHTCIDSLALRSSAMQGRNFRLLDSVAPTVVSSGATHANYRNPSVELPPSDPPDYRSAP